MKLIVGLGNPGKEYEKTRHNVGFMVVDALAAELGVEICGGSKLVAHTGEFQIGGEKVVLMKPQTFMNRSGEAVAKFASYYRLDTKDIWVVSDDLDMPLGRIRTRHEGSSGGHNGLKSMSESLGSEQYTRIRLGIEAFTGNTQASVAVRAEPEASVFVLQQFEKREEPILHKVISQTKMIILDGLEKKQLEAKTSEVDGIVTT